MYVGSGYIPSRRESRDSLRRRYGSVFRCSEFLFIMSLDPALTRAKAAELGLTPGLAVEAAGADTASGYQQVGFGL